VWKKVFHTMENGSRADSGLNPHARWPYAVRMTLRIRTQPVFWLILAAAALLRLMYFMEIRTRPDFTCPGLDAGYHDYWARGIAFGQWTPPYDQPDPMIRSQPYFRPPGYPFFLALVYRLTGGRPAPAHLAQFALGVLNVALAFRFARRRFGATAAAIAAALAATYWVFLYYEGEWLEPALLVTLTWLLLLALDRWLETRKEILLICAGLALGASALVRPNALFLLPAAAAWTVWILHPPRWWGREAQRALALLATGALLMVAPVALRNALVGRDAVLISSNGGINLLLGQDREAVADHASDATGNWSCFDYPAMMAQASAEAGRPLKASETSARYARQARELMLRRPRETLSLLALKTFLFWGPLEVSNNKIEELERTDSRVLRRLPVRFPFVLAGSLLGFFLLSRRRNEPGEGHRASFQMAVLLALFTGVYFLSFLPFIAAGQYRAPLTPILMALAGAGGAEIARLAARRRFGAATAGLAAGALVWAIVSVNFTGYRPNPARWHLTRAIAADRAGMPAEAEREYRAALRDNPDLGVVHNRLGVLLAKQERVAEALPCFEAAVAADPASVEARFNLGLALALNYRWSEAIPYFESVLRDRPDHVDARLNLEHARSLLGRAPASMPDQKEVAP
jgi:tetratricopeptide (TPR) repeat protein